MHALKCIILIYILFLFLKYPLRQKNSDYQNKGRLIRVLRCLLKRMKHSVWLTPWTQNTRVLREWSWCVCSLWTSQRMHRVAGLSPQSLPPSAAPAEPPSAVPALHAPNTRHTWRGRMVTEWLCSSPQLACSCFYLPCFPLSHTTKLLVAPA